MLDLVGSLLEGVGDNSLREVEVCAEVGDALGGEVPVVPAPVEGLLDIAAAVEGLHEADELAVGDLRDEVVLGGKEVLLGDEDALSEEVRVDKVSLLFGDDHVILWWAKVCLLTRRIIYNVIIYFYLFFLFLFFFSFI